MHRHRPAVVGFDTMDEKHVLLLSMQNKWDEHLTRQQLKQRQGLSADFQALKTKGYKTQ